MNKASNVKDNCLEILGEATLQKYAKPSDPRKYFNLKRVPLFCRKLQFPMHLNQTWGMEPRAAARDYGRRG